MRRLHLFSPHRLARTAMGHRLGGFIYGTIVALSVIVGGARAYPHEPGHIAVLVAVTCFVFWLAHIYADAIGKSVARNERLSVVELKEVAHTEASILEAAVPPIIPLLLGALGVFSERTAVWIAFALGFAVLAAQGFVFARVEQYGRLATAAFVAANIGLGGLLVLLKLFVSH